MKKVKPGDRYGKLTVQSIFKKGNYNYAICKCDCGNVKAIRCASLTKQKQPTMSCGCVTKEIASVTGTNDISQNSAKQIERNIKYNTNTQIIKTNKPPKNNKSGIKGVSWDKSRNRWVASLQIHSKTIHLGRFKNIEDAAKARKEAEEKYFKPILDAIEKEKENNEH